MSNVILRRLAGAGLPTEGATWAKLVTLGSLFMAQSLPSAFVTQLLPAIYRKQGLPLEQFWLFSLILVPNWIRWLWAPAIDRFGSPRIGRRKSWIIPCTTLGTTAYAALVLVEPTLDHIRLAIAIMFVQTLVMATQEMAVDAFVVEALKKSERSLAAGIRMYLEAFAELIALAVLGSLYENYGWNTAVLFAAVFLIVFTLPVLLRAEVATESSEAARRDRVAPSVLRFLRRRDSMWIALNVAAAGMSTGSYFSVVGAFLVDRGFDVAAVGMIMGWVIFFGILLGVGGAVIAADRFGPAAFSRFAVVATIPLCLLPAWAATADSISASLAFATLLGPTAMAAGFYVDLQTSRIGWAAGPQVATDFAIGSAFIKIGQSLGIALGGFMAAKLGWVQFFPVYGGMIVLSAGLFVVTAPRIARLIAARMTVLD